ncbi:MAG TPA: family 1 glycosylhydrolase [Tepidisphaeraceae bacterium]|nr:family 1 glycosylhydrolase [Tepidisphaeraceae bacterium]
MTSPPAITPAIRTADPLDTLRFMFAVGIECSCPKIEAGRVDQLRDTGHYEMWQTDLKLVRELGLRYLRYGPPIYRIWKEKGEYDWSFLDPVMHEMRRLGIVPIVDLLHFGLPDWLVDFQNPDWPSHFADYAYAFAERYPWVRYYTPVNEIYVTALFSGAFGWWNEKMMSDAGFVTNLKHCCKASISAMRRILDLRPDAIFIFSESTEYVHPGSPDTVASAHFMNERRFLSLDLLFGHDVSATIYRYLMASGMTDAEYWWFMQQRDLRTHCIMGTDYYITNEHVLRSDGRSIGAGDVYGYYVITRQYYERYRVPVMHTETNRTAKHAVEWLWKEWMNLLRLREDGVPIIGFTWFGLLDMKDWDTALTKMRGTVNKVGLYTLARKPRKVAREYRRLVEEYSHLPISSTKFPILTA